jgi:hypothetical protein
MSEQTTTATTEERLEADELPTVEVDDAAVTDTFDDLTAEVASDPDVPEHGRRTEVAADPAARARQLADELGADIATDVRATEAAVRSRRDAGRLVLGDDRADADVLARADDIRSAAAAPPPVSPAQVAEIRQLAAELRAAARIRERTEAKAVDELRERLSAYSGLTVHPSAIRAAADAVAVAAAALADAELALAAEGEDLVLAELSEGETRE